MNGPQPPMPPPSPAGAGAHPAVAPDLALGEPGAVPSDPRTPAAGAEPRGAGTPPEIAPQLSAPSRVVPGESDEVLAGQASRGDVQAFEILVDRYQRVVFNLTYRMTGNWQDARELTQDVFVRIWRGLHGFDTRLRFFSWMYRIAIHACLNRRRSAGREQALGWELESREAGPERQAETTELERQVHAALARLSDGDRQLVVLRHFLDRSYEEIAEIMGIPGSRVKSRLFTARQRLRHELEQQGVTP